MAGWQWLTARLPGDSKLGRDTGIGIADVDKERLFQPFPCNWIVDWHDSVRALAWGLSLVARLADLHGGHVALEQKSSLLLPALLPALPIEGLQRVLVVEDSRPMRAISALSGISTRRCGLPRRRGGGRLYVGNPARPDILLD